MFNSVINESVNVLSFLEIVGFSILLGLLHSYIEMKTNKYSKNFIITLSVLPVLVSMVILMVNGNLGTGIAVLGSFSLIRFRSVPGNSREILSVFFSMVIGLSLGTGYIAFGVILTIIVSLYLIILKVMKYGEKEKSKILSILIPEDLDYTNIFNDIMDKYTSSNELIKTKTTNMGTMYELTYNITMKSDINEKEFIDDIRVRNGNLKVSLSSNMLGSEL